jgi:hypothetical protein
MRVHVRRFALRSPFGMLSWSQIGCVSLCELAFGHLSQCVWMGDYRMGECGTADGGVSVSFKML